MRLTVLLCTVLGVITAAAVTLGWMNSPSQVTLPVKDLPITESYDYEKTGSLESRESSEAPRFIYDEPLSEQPVTSAASKESTNNNTSSVVSESSQPKDSEKASSSEAVPVTEAEKTPTQSEIDAVAAEHLRELDALTDRMTAALDSLAQQALEDYRMLPDPDSRVQLGILVAKYMPSVYKLEEDADSEAEEIFQNLEAALTEIGADRSTAVEARLSYEAAKAAQLNYYKELASAYQAQEAEN